MPDDPQVTFRRGVQFRAAEMLRARGHVEIADALLRNVTAHDATADRLLEARTELRAHHARLHPLPATMTEIAGSIRPMSMRPEPPEAA